MKTDIIIQARIGSTRLPGKVMLSLAGKPVLWHVIERCKQCKNVDDVIIATTTNSEDDIIERWCIRNKVKYYRGSSSNVLERYYETAKKYKSDNIVRVTSDCPFIDNESIDQLIKVYDNKGYITNYCLGKTIAGLGFEIFSFSMLETTYELALTDFDKEHVVPFMLKNYKNTYIENYNENGNIRLTLDEISDYELINLLYDQFYINGQIIGLNSIISFLEKNQNINNINNNINQKT